MKKYPIEQLYLIDINGKKVIALLDENECVEVNSGKKIVNYRIIDSLKNILIAQNLEIFIIDINGNLKDVLNISDIQFLYQVLQKKLTLSVAALQRIKVLSNNITNIISDLLGLNVTVNPNTQFNLANSFDIAEVVVSAKKLAKFKYYLSKYLRAYLIANKNVEVIYEVGSRDYRITKALNEAKIMVSESIKQNIFTLSTTVDGKILVNGIDIRKININQGFQKTINF